MNGEIHGKPAYKKDERVSGIDAMLYFWGERNGPSFSGWRFGPKVDSERVRAHHPSRMALTPPRTGWKVPYIMVLWIPPL